MSPILKAAVDDALAKMIQGGSASMARRFRQTRQGIKQALPQLGPRGQARAAGLDQRLRAAVPYLANRAKKYGTKKPAAPNAARRFDPVTVVDEGLDAFRAKTAGFRKPTFVRLLRTHNLASEDLIEGARTSQDLRNLLWEAATERHRTLGSWKRK